MNTETWLTNYTNWLRQQYHVTHLSGSDTDEISTPFLNNLNDNIRLYTSVLPHDKIQLDDDGETLNNLELLGVNLKSPLRRKIIQNTCQEFSITLNQDILQITGNASDFPAMKQHLISAILRIDDISLLKKSNVQALFSEELYTFLDAHDFGGLPQYSLSGRTGNTYKIDYVIPQNHAQNKPLRLIDFQDRLSFNQVAVAAYKFKDISGNLSADASFSIIFNESDHTPPIPALNAASDSGINLFSWRQPSRLNDLK